MGLWRRRPQNKKWDSRPQLYQGSYYFWRRVMQVLVAVGLMASVAAAGIYVHDSDMMNLESIEVLGDFKYLRSDDVIALSQLRDTDKVFAVQPRQIQQRILKHPWVRAVNVRRHFPHTIQIEVEEREPYALLDKGERFLVDRQGVVFKRWSEGDPLDLPILSGFEDFQFEKYPKLVKSYFRFAFSFLKFLQNQKFFEEQKISEVHFHAVLGFTVFTADSGLEIFYGQDDFLQKQKKLDLFAASSHYGEARYVRLDLNLHDKVVARQRPLMVSAEEPVLKDSILDAPTSSSAQAQGAGVLRD